MNLAWVHIIVVHIPVLGTGLLVYMGLKSVYSLEEKRLKSFYWSSLLVAIFASLAYFTGPSTADWVKNSFSNYPQDLVENHALWGRFGFTISILSALLGVMAISNYAQDEPPHKAIPWVLLSIQILLLVLFIYTAHLGGLIRRPDLL